MSNRHTDLEKKITSALAESDIASDDIAALLQETEAAIVAADEAAKLEAERALDPSRSPDPVKARAAMENAAFAANRLRTMVPRLQARYNQIAKAEDLERWRGQRAAIEVTRDALAAEFSEVYPEIERKLVDLLSRMAINDADIARLHTDAPDGTGNEFLLGPELTARGLAAFSREDPSIAGELRLPSFEGDRRVWPPPQLFDPELFAPAPFDRRYSPEWWQVKEEEAAALRERDEREAAEEEARVRARPGVKWWEKERT